MSTDWQPRVLPNIWSVRKHTNTKSACYPHRRWIPTKLMSRSLAYLRHPRSSLSRSARCTVTVTIYLFTIQDPGLFTSHAVMWQPGLQFHSVIPVNYVHKLQSDNCWYKDLTIFGQFVCVGVLPAVQRSAPGS
ncbi:hypothetical protein BDR04DRAFT_1094156 [Suillus decipiens]|nr:hypothetical protein BDR04DRAFT_1094156 [Suillus decipiens]